ncbi:MAG: hypothetical protein ACXVK4_01785 [Acidimicrobiia bacterium]
MDTMCSAPRSLDVDPGRLLLAVDRLLADRGGDARVEARPGRLEITSFVDTVWETIPVPLARGDFADVIGAVTAPLALLHRRLIEILQASDGRPAVALRMTRDRLCLDRLSIGLRPAIPAPPRPSRRDDARPVRLSAIGPGPWCATVEGTEEVVWVSADRARRLCAIRPVRVEWFRRADADFVRACGADPGDRSMPMLVADAELVPA